MKVKNSLATWNACLFTHWCFLMSRSLVHGLEHAFPGRLLHHAGGEETAENTQFTLPERLCGPARPPYNCQKHMGAAQPQREMKSWRKINDKWMHWINSGCRGEVVCASMCEYACVCVCVYFHLNYCPHNFPVNRTGNYVREWVWWRLTCVCLFIIHQWLVIGCCDRLEKNSDWTAGLSRMG